MRLDLSDTGAGVMSVGFIIYIGSAAWPGGLLGDPFGLRSTLAPSCYRSYLGMGHILVRRRRHRPPAS